MEEKTYLEDERFRGLVRELRKLHQGPRDKAYYENFGRLYNDASNLLTCGEYQMDPEIAYEILDEMIAEEKMRMSEEQKASLNAMSEERLLAMNEAEFDDWVTSFKGCDMTLEEAKKLNCFSALFRKETHKAERAILEAEWQKQRALRGFSDGDLLDFQKWFMATVGAMLKEYAKGPYPLRMSKEELETLSEAFQKWAERGSLDDAFSAISLFAKLFPAIGWDIALQ